MELVRFFRHLDASKVTAVVRRSDGALREVSLEWRAKDEANTPAPSEWWKAIQAEIREQERAESDVPKTVNELIDS